MKMLRILVAVLLAMLFFVRVNYRVEGNFILRSDEVSYLTAPFDGYIEKVSVRPGDNVAAGAPLVSLNVNELKLDEASAQADLTRYKREAEKARATKALTDMRIAESLVDQTQSRLDLIRYRIEHAVI